MLAATLACCAIVVVAVPACQSRAAAQEQVAFITTFYKNYLSRNWRGRSDTLPIGVFYSREVDALLTRNADLCERLSRGDEICGYNADSDVILGAQEYDPLLDFAKSGFRAVVSGKNTVDVSFNVYPEYGKDYERTIRYVFIREDGGWRVDDVLFEDDRRFKADQSMRHEITRENDAIVARAGNLAEVVDWVSGDLGHPDMLYRAERFATDPVRICSEDGTCEAVTKGKGATKLRETMEVLYRAYHVDNPDTYTNLTALLPKTVAVARGKVVGVDALEFTYLDNAWWMTGIDLRKLGSAVPTARTQAK